MNREILRLALPNIISNISVPLLSSVDTALMGRLSELHLGAVGLGAMVFNFLYWNFGFLRMGTTGITAQAYGRNNTGAMANSMGRALLLGWLLAAALLLLQIPLSMLGLWAFQVEGAQTKLVETYFYIRIWEAPATLGLYVLMGWFFGMLNVWYPLLLTIVVNCINIAISYFLVQHLEWGISGVAWGTVIAQYSGLLLGLLLFYFRYGRTMLPEIRLPALIDPEALRHFFQINRDIFLRTLALTFAFGFFYSQSSGQGELILASNIILLQFLNWMSYGVDGFAYAAESIVGKYAGASKPLQVRRAVQHIFLWGMGLALMFSALYGFGGELLLRVFTNQQPVISTAIPYLVWMIWLPIIGTPCYLWDGIFVGLTASQAMRNSMLLALAVFLLSWFLLASAWGNHGLWLALLLFLGARGAFQTVQYFSKNFGAA